MTNYAVSHKGGVIIPLTAPVLSMTANIYWVVYPSGDADPSAANIIAGTVSGGIHANEPAPVGSGAFSGTTISGLSASTSYKLAAVWDDGTDTSNVAVSSAFVTAAGFQSAWARGANVMIGGAP